MEQSGVDDVGREPPDLSAKCSGPSQPGATRKHLHVEALRDQLRLESALARVDAAHHRVDVVHT
ncbi:hypothetical protein NHL50_09475 [Acidimicrobiia bacterium EGI L10123]|nr:hypothetical protein [Acidimicrobiia bacterium EGI L10123]